MSSIKTKERNALIFQRYKEGYSAQQLMDEFKLSYASIRRIVSRERNPKYKYIPKYNEFSVTILKVERLKRGLTQEQLAEKCKVSHATISLLEGGYAHANLELAFALWAVFEDKTINELFHSERE